MGSLLRRALAVFSIALPALLSGIFSPPVLGQDLRERDALCNADGCFMVYFQRRTFLDSWRACKDKGGDLATVKRNEDALVIASLFSTLDLRHSRTKVQVWIGLQRQPRQCTAARPLRGFSWTTGDQDTTYTNWQKEDSPSLCLTPRCVVMSYSTMEPGDNFKWLDGSCSIPVDGYLCHYTYKGMCPPLLSEGAGNTLYATPFDLLSTLLTHVPFGSVATVPCPASAQEELSTLCTLREDGSVGWSPEPLHCSALAAPHNRCEQNNGGCEHFCQVARGHFYCECGDGFLLGDDGRSCVLSDACQGAPCEFKCMRVPGSYRCACPEGYMLAADGQSCLDVDECLQSPCEHLCENTLGTFQCLCQEGYFLDEKGACEDVDECNDDPCEHACENTLGSHICHCRLGFSPVHENPSQCQDDDECQFSGTCEQMCVNYEGGFECYCEEGYELMPDQYSCRRIGDGDAQSAVTPSFPWATHQPGPVWVPVDYDWSPEQSHTGWPAEGEPSLDWLTDPPRVLNPDIIWVTSGPQEELPFDAGLHTIREFSEKVREEEGGSDWLDLGQRSQSELKDFLTTPQTTPVPSTSSPTPTPDWYDDEEETTTAAPDIPTSTASEGAWNWWAELATASQGPENTEAPVTDHNTSTESTDPTEADEKRHLQGENSLFSEEESEVKDGDGEGVTHSQAPALPTEPTASHHPPPREGGGGDVDILDPVQGDRGPKQSSTGLLVGLLVPVCILVVAMVALAIICCTRGTVQPRSKNASDCYHWISGAHDKQGTP